MFAHYWETSGNGFLAAVQDDMPNSTMKSLCQSYLKGKRNKPERNNQMHPLKYSTFDIRLF